MKGEAGYSLFEVLIAFVIMTLVLSALIPGQTWLLRRAIAQEDRLLAHDYALSRLAALGVTVPMDLGEQTDTYRDWQIATSITQGEQFRNGTASFVATITVSTQRGDILATVETVLVAP